MDYALARDNMIEQQVRPWDVLDQRVLDTFANVPRENFVSPEYKNLAFADTRLPIGNGQKMLNPNLEGRILQNLMINKEDRVLEIGTGSGYLTACLASMARHVDSLEKYLELTVTAQSNLAELSIENVTISNTDASATNNSTVMYQVILLSGSLEIIPESFKQRLEVNGRLFGFVGKKNQPVHHGVLITRISEAEWSEENLFETWVEPLEGF